MMFSLKNEANGLTTHCGVLEFIAEQGRIYIPRWVLIWPCRSSVVLLIMSLKSR